MLIIWPRVHLARNRSAKSSRWVIFDVVLVRELVDRKEPLVRVEREVPRVVVGEVPRVRAVADDEELDEAEKRLGVSVTRVVLGSRRSAPWPAGG